MTTRIEITAAMRNFNAALYVADVLLGPGADAVTDPHALALLLEHAGFKTSAEELLCAAAALGYLDDEAGEIPPFALARLRRKVEEVFPTTPTQ